MRHCTASSYSRPQLLLQRDERGAARSEQSHRSHHPLPVMQMGQTAPSGTYLLVLRLYYDGVSGECGVRTARSHCGGCGGGGTAG